MLLGKKKSVAGLDVGSSSIKMVELEGKANNRRVEFVKM